MLPQAISIPKWSDFSFTVPVPAVTPGVISIPKWSDFSRAEICPIFPNTPYNLAPQTLKIVDL